MAVPPEDPAIESYVALLKHVRLVSPFNLTRALDAFYAQPAETAAADAARDARRQQLHLQKHDPLQAEALAKDIQSQASLRVARFAQKLIELKLLTSWQQKQLAQGSNKGFFLAGYKLLGPIGKGGMSKLYLAEMSQTPEVAADRMPNRGDRVAIKVFPKNLLGNRSFLDRFYREGRMMADFDHPHVVRGYGMGRVSKTHYYAMEFVPGRDLGKVVERTGPLEYIEAAEYVRQAAAGLEYLHRRGIIHRDIKPGNLMLDGSGLLKILDFGLALSRHEQADHSLTLEHGERLLGTSDYMAPEQARDCHGVDLRADLYSLGCVLYFLIAGQAPFAEGSLAQRIMSHQHAEVPPLRKRRIDCPPIFEDLCAKLLAKQREDRSASANEVHDVLANWLADRHARQARPTAPVRSEAGEKRPEPLFTSAPSVPESNDAANMILDSGTVANHKPTSETVAFPKLVPLPPKARPTAKPSVSDSSLLEALPNGLADQFAPAAMIVPKREPAAEQTSPGATSPAAPTVPANLEPTLVIPAEDGETAFLDAIADLGGPAPGVKPVTPARAKVVLQAPAVQLSAAANSESPGAQPAPAAGQPGKAPQRPGSTVNSAEFAAEFLQKREIARRIKREPKKGR